MGKKNSEDSSTEAVHLGEESPISLPEIRERCSKTRRDLFVDKEDAHQIEKATVGQSLNTNKCLHRKRWITASKCHCFATFKDTTSRRKALEEVLRHKKIPSN